MFYQLGSFGQGHNFPNWVMKCVPDPSRVHLRRAHAAFIIQQLGPKAAAAIPALMSALRESEEEDEIWVPATEALQAMGEAALVVLPQLREAAINANEAVSSASLMILASIGAKARPAVPDMEQLVRKMDSKSFWAAKALLKINQDTNTALRVFSALAQGPDLRLRILALKGLEGLGIAGKTATPVVAVVLQDHELGMRRQAERTLRRIDPILLETLLDRMNQQAVENVPHFIEIIESGSLSKQTRALQALALLGPAARTAVPALVKALESTLTRNITVPSSGFSNQDPGRQIAETLGEIGPEAASAVPALVRLLQQDPDANAAFCCRALGNIGPAAHEARPALVQFVQSTNAAVRLASVEALARIDSIEASNLVALLRRFQHDPQTEVRLRATVALWKLGLEPEPPIAALIDETAKPLLQGRPNSPDEPEWV